tara:strand:- start:1183 stop:2625 length:1443 start_codon:yes stop_codon:yes gene_type:complete
MELNRRNYISQSLCKKFVLSCSYIFFFFLYFSITTPKVNLSQDIQYNLNLDNQYLKLYKNSKTKQNNIAPLKKIISPRNKSKSSYNIEKHQIANSVSKMYISYFEKNNYLHFNKKMRRIIKSFLQFEIISRKRFNRGTKSLSNQAELLDLADHIAESRWYREAIKKFSSNNAYGFSEERLLRVLFSIQVASNSFNIPYPALFCLFFQESKFDFLANSHTGAKGIGQLTSIAIREVSRLRNNPKKELLLQNTASHLNKVYNDPQINLWLKELGFKINLPKISPIPKKIEFTKLNSDFMRDVGKELIKNGHSYGKNIGLLWYLSKKIRRGKILPERYAHTHKIFSQMLANRYASSPSSAYNIETNILLSSMLFNHYYRYKWQKGEEIFILPEDTRIILAASAYNQGQTGIRRFLINLKQEFPSLEFKKFTANKLKNYFTSERIRNAVYQTDLKIRETYIHVKKIMECSTKKPISLKNNKKKI